jgi:phage terminase small subunit
LARARDPNRDKAFDIYMKHKGNIDLVEIASQLNTSPGSVRGWKSKDKWEQKLNGTLQSNTERSFDISWIDVEQEYVTDIRKKPCSLEDLAEKYYIPLMTIKDRCKKDEWVKKRTEYILSTSQKAIEKASNKDADRISKLIRITDIAANKAEQALSELETFMVKNKKLLSTIM